MEYETVPVLAVTCRFELVPLTIVVPPSIGEYQSEMPDGPIGWVLGAYSGFVPPPCVRVCPLVVDRLTMMMATTRAAVIAVPSRNVSVVRLITSGVPLVTLRSATYSPSAWLAALPTVMEYGAIVLRTIGVW